MRNHFLRFSERDFLFYSCLKNGLSATRKCTFSFEERYFIKKKSHVDRINLHRNVCDEATVRNHFLSERAFRFIRI